MSRITSGNNLQSHCQPSSFAFYDLRSLPVIICSFFLLFFFRFDPAYCSSWKKIFFSYYSYIIVVMSECECEWIFSVLAFCSVATPWKGEAVTFWWQSSLGIKKKRTIYFAIPYPNFDLIINFDIQGIDKVFNSTLIDYLVNITYKKFKNWKKTYMENHGKLMENPWNFIISIW